jgi:hypothetical protein
MWNKPALTLPLCFDEATRKVSKRLTEAGFAVVRSFDLRSVQSTSFGGVCPNHGTAACDCELAIFLVYAATGDPVPVLARSHNRRTWLSVVETVSPSPHHQPTLVRALAELVASLSEMEDER